MVMRIFRDSVTPSAIPLDSTAGVLAYANGAFKWSAGEISRFTDAGRVVARIDVNGDVPHEASILDVEKFDATPQIARDWIRARNNFRPGTATIYTSRAALSELFDATEGLRYWLLIADWTGKPHQVKMPLPPGVKIAGVQFANLAQWDVSAIYADSWHRQ